MERLAEVGAVGDVAVGTVEGMFEQIPCALCLGYAGVELGNLAFDKPIPPWAPAGPRGQQLTNFVEREPRVLAQANECEALGARSREMAFPAGALGGRKQADSLVVAQCRGRSSGLAGELSDGYRGISIRHVPSLDLKCTSTCSIGDLTQQEASRMQLREKLESRIRTQFGRPTGVPGRLAGWFMAHRSSNCQRNIWAVSLLDVRRDDRVLEIGSGPGVAIAELSRRASQGYVCGLDHSDVMVRQAAKRNAEGLRRGQVELRLGSHDDLPSFDKPFDKILAVNALQFWNQPIEGVSALRRLLRTGGRIAIAFQPRGTGATDDAANKAGQMISAVLREAGFSAVRLETLKLKPAVVCALGVNSPGADSPSEVGGQNGS
jgi:SAM-dependent methyltransferase